METKEKILVIDDLESIVNMLDQLLSSAGYNILKAHSGKEGLAALKKDKPDLILLDVEMPEMDGYQTCASIRKDPANDSIPIIMLTVKSQVSDIVRALDEGADDYMIKNPSKKEFFTKISFFLARAKEGKLPSQHHFKKTGRRKSS